MFCCWKLSQKAAGDQASREILFSPLTYASVFLLTSLLLSTPLSSLTLPLPFSAPRKNMAVICQYHQSIYSLCSN